MILAFVMTKDRKQVKIVGIVLIIIAFVNLIAISAFGIIGFILNLNILSADKMLNILNINIK